MPSPDLCRDLVSETKADLVDLLHVGSHLLLCRPLSAALYCTLETVWFRNAFVRIIIVGKEAGDKSTITSLVSRREMCARRYAVCGHPLDAYEQSGSWNAVQRPQNCRSG